MLEVEVPAGLLAWSDSRPTPLSAVDIEHEDFEWLRAYLQRESSGTTPISDTTDVGGEVVGRKHKSHHSSSHSSTSGDYSCDSPTDEHRIVTSDSWDGETEGPSKRRKVGLALTLARTLTPALPLTLALTLTPALTLPLPLTEPEPEPEPERTPTRTQPEPNPYPYPNPNPNPNQVGWTSTEDLVILTSVRKLGTQWPRIASQLPGRTADAVIPTPVPPSRTPPLPPIPPHLPPPRHASHLLMHTELAPLISRPSPRSPRMPLLTTLLVACGRFATGGTACRRPTPWATARRAARRSMLCCSPRACRG